MKKLWKENENELLSVTLIENMYLELFMAHMKAKWCFLCAERLNEHGSRRMIIIENKETVFHPRSDNFREKLKTN